MFKKAFLWLLVLATILIAGDLLAKDPTEKLVEKMISGGNYRDAADFLAPKIAGGEKMPQSVNILYGRALEGIASEINEAADYKCYRAPGAPRITSCMETCAAEANRKYGEGSFTFNKEMLAIKYTGINYAPTAAVNGDGSAAEAAYLTLTKNLVGHPSVVLPRIQQFLNDYPKGDWHRKGLLLWARINEDVWWIHRNWSWLIYNWRLSPEEIVVRAEPYRQEAIKTYKKIRGGDDAKLAKQELKLLMDNKSDGKMYGIVNEADVGGTSLSPGESNVK